jgi:hypothetical protein
MEKLFRRALRATQLAIEEEGAEHTQELHSSARRAIRSSGQQIDVNGGVKM